MKNLLLYVPLMALAFTACSEEDIAGTKGSTPMTVNVTNNCMPSRATADIVEETTLPANAQIGVSVLTGATGYDGWDSLLSLGWTIQYSDDL